MTWESLPRGLPGTARVPDDGGRRSSNRCTATEQNRREIPVDDFTPDEPAGWAGMTVRVKYQWSGGAWRTREVRLSPTRLDDIPDSVIVTFRPEGGDIKVGVGLGRERVLTRVANGHEVDLDVPVGPVAIWFT